MRTLSHTQRDMLERILHDVHTVANRSPDAKYERNSQPFIITVKLTLPELIELPALLKHIRESRRALKPLEIAVTPPQPISVVPGRIKDSYKEMSAPIGPT